MTVAVRTVTEYDRQAVKTAIDDALRTLPQDPLDACRTVLLKPNFIVPEDHRKASTTHPEFYLAAAELLLDAGKAVTIADSPAFGSTGMCIRAHKARAECRRLGVNILNLRRSRRIDGVPKHPHYGTLSIAADLERFDAVVNLPKLKVHGQFVFTGATKNLFGCVVGKRKAYRHFRSQNCLEGFARMIHATAAAVNPVLNLGDGIAALHKNGPRNGEPYPLETVVVSDSYLEFDWYFARRIGLDPATTPLFRVVPKGRRQQLEAACKDLFTDPAFTVPDDFVPAPPNPIEFTLGRVVRSVWKSIRTRSLTAE